MTWCLEPVESLIKGGMQGMFDGARDLAHPEHHGAENTHGDQADDAFEQFLLFLREFGADQLQATANQQSQRGGEEHPDPHRRIHWPRPVCCR